MSPEVATIIAGSLAIVGVLVGLFAERLLRSRGEVFCQNTGVEWTFQYRDDRGASYGDRSRSMKGLGPIHRGDVAQAEHVEYKFRADFYNSRDIPTGLRAFEVVFHRPDDRPMIDRGLLDAGTRRTWNNIPRMGPLAILNLPPRQLVSVEVVGSAPDPSRLEGCYRVELRAKSPDDGEFLHELATLDPTIVLT